MTNFEDSENTNPSFELGDSGVNATGEQHDDPIPDAAITAPDDRGEPAATEVTDVPPVRQPFGTLSTATREATHPFLLSESVDPHELDRYYGTSYTVHDTRQAWHDVEHTLADPRYPRLESAKFHVARDVASLGPVEPDPEELFAERFASSRDAGMWYDAAQLQASLPAFEDRARDGQVSRETAGQVYGNLVMDVLPDTIEQGDRAEALVGALAAREAFFGDPKNFLYPTGPREGNNPYHPDGKSLNHDFVRIDDGVKVPVEVKTSSRTTLSTPYDRHTVLIRFANDVGPAIVGRDAMPRSASITPFVPTITQRAHELMRRELTEAVRMPELDLAAAALYRKIDEKVRHVRVPERFGLHYRPPRG
jgi:hypothetical protein